MHLRCGSCVPPCSCVKPPAQAPGRHVQAAAATQLQSVASAAHLAPWTACPVLLVEAPPRSSNSPYTHQPSTCGVPHDIPAQRSADIPPHHRLPPRLALPTRDAASDPAQHPAPAQLTRPHYFSLSAQVSGTCRQPSHSDVPAGGVLCRRRRPPPSSMDTCAVLQRSARPAALLNALRGTYCTVLGANRPILASRPPAGLVQRARTGESQARFADSVRPVLSALPLVSRHPRGVADAGEWRGGPLWALERSLPVCRAAARALSQLSGSQNVRQRTPRMT